MATSTFTLEQSTLNNIRSLPPNTYLVHATNCLAEWGSGIAAELARIFPAACAEYKKFCNAAKMNPSARWPPQSLTGRCLIIPPQPSDIAAGAPNIHIICLFTSYGYGRPNARIGKPGKDNKRTILAQTDSALKELRTKLEAQSDGDTVVYSPMFNSGAFSVPWDDTVRVIERGFEGWDGRWLVMAPPS